MAGPPGAWRLYLSGLLWICGGWLGFLGPLAIVGIVLRRLHTRAESIGEPCSVGEQALKWFFHERIRSTTFVALLLSVLIADFLTPMLSGLAVLSQPAEPNGGWVIETPGPSIDVQSPGAIALPAVLAMGIALILPAAFLLAMWENVPLQNRIAHRPFSIFMNAVGIWGIGGLILIRALDALGHALYPAAF